MSMRMRSRQQMKIPKDKILHFTGCEIGALISVPEALRAEVQGALDAVEASSSQE